MLTAKPAQGIRITGAEKVVSSMEQNVIWKAATQLRKKVFSNLKHAPGIGFHLEKNLPAGAGLGGGSSNAAAALKLCCQIWEINPKADVLHQIAAEIGADIPFFLTGGTQFAEGIGEKLQKAPPPRNFHVLIATPQQHVSTAWAYGQISNIGEKKWNHFQKVYLQKHLEADFYRQLHNDFEEPILKSIPELSWFKKQLEKFSPVKAMLSGSGASFFALFQSYQDAQNCMEHIRGKTRFCQITEFASETEDVID